MIASEISVTESRSLTRVRVISDKDTSIDEIISMMRSEHFSGQVVVQMYKGGIRKISAEESVLLP